MFLLYGQETWSLILKKEQGDDSIWAYEDVGGGLRKYKMRIIVICTDHGILYEY
jgi:hypothetical protein